MPDAVVARPARTTVEEAPAAEDDEINAIEVSSVCSDDLSAPGLLDDFDESEWPSAEDLAVDCSAEEDVTDAFDIDIEIDIDIEHRYGERR